MDLEPYGSGDLRADSSDDEPPSFFQASASKADDPEDPENPSGKTRREKRKSRRHERCPSKEAEAFATLKIVLNLPEFTQKDLSEFVESFGLFPRMTVQTHAGTRVKWDLLLQCCKTKYLDRQVKQIVTTSATFADVLVARYASNETDPSIWTEI